jgi:hypothetical protein
MYAERLIVETDQSGTPKHLPRLPPNKQLEIILLVLDDARGDQASRRTPHPDIAGKISIFGDVISTVPQTDWNLPK